MDAITQEYERLRKLGPAELKRELDADDPRPQPDFAEALAAQVRKIIAAQDTRGRWIERRRPAGKGKNEISGVIRCITFNRNVEMLSRYLAATRATAPAK
jgi:hypothetical protein